MVTGQAVATCQAGHTIATSSNYTIVAIATSQDVINVAIAMCVAIATCVVPIVSTSYQMQVAPGVLCRNICDN